MWEKEEKHFKTWDGVVKIGGLNDFFFFYLTVFKNYSGYIAVASAPIHTLLDFLILLVVRDIGRSLVQINSKYIIVDYNLS